MKNILITGGPVHAHLDAVKVITNRFKGGLMSELAEQLASYDTRIVYLCAPQVGAVTPKNKYGNIEVVTHYGFSDYLEKVRHFAPEMDAVVLGAAVANLIPVKPWRGKFPSHDYNVGDVIPIDFTIAPRVIDEVKKVAPKTHLFGYKLLSGVPHDELIRAAYGIVLESKATAVIANDAENLLQKYAVTKERGVHPLSQKELPEWLWDMMNDTYYTSILSKEVGVFVSDADRFHSIIRKYADRFTHTESGLVFGTVAMRIEHGFLTTGRGKREVESTTVVTYVDHQRHCVYVGNALKASLNAPLLSRLLEDPNVDHVVHYHEQVSGLPTCPYAPPGTVRDTERDMHTSFNIEGHGCMLLFDREGNQL